jgi:hypothetical protein
MASERRRKAAEEKKWQREKRRYLLGLREWFHKHGFRWNPQSASATCEDNEITLSQSTTGITLKNGDDKEIDIALRLISAYKWKKLYCSGDEEFLLKVMSIAIHNHSQIIPSLEQVTAKLHKVGGKGFSETDDWSPTPRPRPKPEPKDHDNGYGHRAPGD